MEYLHYIYFPNCSHPWELPLIIHWGHIVATMMYGYMFYIKKNNFECETYLQINIDGDHSCLCKPALDKHLRVGITIG